MDRNIFIFLLRFINFLREIKHEHHSKIMHFEKEKDIIYFHKTKEILLKFKPIKTTKINQNLNTLKSDSRTDLYQKKKYLQHHPIELQASME